MKKLLIFISILLGIPLFAGAHGTEGDFGDIQTGAGMMQYIEDKALGEELHEEMEELMVKVMAGTLTEEESGRLAELMDQYPGPMGMMMDRMMGMGTTGFGTGMVGVGSFWVWIVGLTTAVWLVVGVLAVMWLWKQIRKQ
jgi:hypothetical protein